MTDEALGRGVARVIEAEDRAPEARAAALATGEVTEEEARAALAGRADAEDLLAACRPLDEGFRERVVETLVARREASAADEVRPPDASSGRRSHHVTSRGLGRQGRLRRAWWIGVGGASVAAAVAILLVGPAAAPLPPYAESFRAGDAQLRGPEPRTGAPRAQDGLAPVRLRRDSTLEWELYPATSAGAVEVRGWVWKGATATRWSPPFEVSPAGAVRIVGVVSELALPSGESTLVVTVARPGAEISDLPGPVAAGAPPAAGVSFRHAIIVED